MAISQVFVSEKAFSTPTTKAAWHDKPIFAIVSTQDKALNPDLEWWMYKRAGADVTEIRASHAVYMSKPRAVVGVIEKAAAAAKQEKPATGFTKLGWRGHMKRFQGTCFAHAAIRCSSASSTGL
jgi:hypothetical protein